MTTSKNSLSGKNGGGRVSSASSSLASSINFKKLRKLDRDITFLDKDIKGLEISGLYFNYLSPKDIEKLKIRRAKLDEKRKNLRNKRKGYE